MRFRGPTERYVIIALVFALAGVASGLAVAVRALRAGGEPTEALAPAEGEAFGGGQTSIDGSRHSAIVSAAQRVGPATVSISVDRQRIIHQGGMQGQEFFERFYRGYFPDRQYVEDYESFGSGVIIDPDGYILTNDHVVRAGRNVRVTLTDGREFSGRVLGGDARYDLAVVKVEGEDLPFAALGDSDDLTTGEWVVAIGNPFGYLLNDPQPSVTAGVVSAVHRDVPSGEESGAVYKDMIQTDAAINPGNSGGPLVNGSGAIVGINAFIFSASGGSQGLGFAIPVNVAKRVINELIEFGRVRDVWLGVQVQEMSPVLARAIGREATNGVMVSFIEPGSPADRAGMESGDVVVGVNGEPVEGVRSARRAIFGSRVGDVITLEVDRRGSRRNFAVKLEEVPR